MACSNEELPPILQYIYFKDGFAYASNAHILVKNKLTEITERISEDELAILDGKLIHKSIFKKILVHEKIQITGTGIVCKTPFFSIEYKFSSDDNLKYPNAELILQKALKNNGSANKLSLNISLLYKLEQSLYDCRNPIFVFGDKPSDSILVKSQDKSVESFGIIMPVMISES